MDVAHIFFGGWQSLARIVMVAVPIYTVLLLMLNVMGKHALARTSAYGFVITVALGSALASAVMTTSVTLANGALGIGVLLGLQYVLSTVVSRWRWAERIITEQATLLVRDGRLLHEALRRERVTNAEVLAAVRKQGIDALEKVGAVVLETDGSFSVIAQVSDNPTALRDVRHE